MRIVAISDTHSQHSKIKLPDGDILIHAGDATWRGEIDESAKFCGWLGKLLERKKYRHILFTPGNHDFLWEKNNLLGRQMVKDSGAIYLEDSFVEIDGIKFYGSPWQPWFYDWAFNLSRGPEIKEKWDLIPDGIDVLITHGPVYGIHDFTLRDQEHVGCKDLLAAVYRIKPRVHIGGHIHEGYGVKEFDGIKFINPSTCTLGYDPINPPIVFDLERMP